MARNHPNLPRVFCIGWHKTGTSTLGLALVKLGYSVVGARLDLVHPLRRGDVGAALDVAAQFDALQDVPWAALYAELDQRFPGSRFILTKRDEQGWLRSALGHFGDTHIPLHEWLYGKSRMSGNEDLYLERFRRHYRDVEAYFRAREGDLLIMDLPGGDGWEKMCNFLGRPIPKRPFPHVNKGRHSLNNADKLRNAVRAGLPKSVREAVFRCRLGVRNLLGLPDPRNIFNNHQQNQREIRAALEEVSNERSAN